MSRFGNLSTGRFPSIKNEVFSQQFDLSTQAHIHTKYLRVFCLQNIRVRSLRRILKTGWDRDFRVSVSIIVLITIKQILVDCLSKLSVRQALAHGYISFVIAYIWKNFFLRSYFHIQRKTTLFFCKQLSK